MNDLSTANNGAAMQPATAGMPPETVRAMAQVQAQMVMARQFPRDEQRAYAAIMQSCRRFKLANEAVYRYTRGGSTISGPSIRLAEELARRWGNIDYGIAELERRDGGAVLEAYAWDLETNTRRSMRFFVRHERHTRNGSYTLDDPRDIYELNANNGARRVRACILAVIPGDVAEEAVRRCEETIEGGDGTPLADRVRKMVSAFAEIGVSADMLEQRLGHALSDTSAAEIVDLTAIYRTLTDNPNKRGDFFEVRSASRSSALAALDVAQSGDNAAANAGGDA